MRMMFTASLDVTAANAAIKSGALPKLIEHTVKSLKAEAAYFTTECGKRSGFFIFDLKDSSQIPGIAEPWFMQLNAEVDFRPVMNLEDLKKGIEAAMKAG